MHFVYILYSPRSDKYYVGETENITERVRLHNAAYFENSSTSFANDWQPVLVISVDNRNDARKVEAFIKSMKSKKFIQKLIGQADFLATFKNIVREKLQINIT